MKDIIKLALRNLKEHKSKTLIISMFVLFGVAIVIMGNSFIESISRGLENDFRANYTGDVVITTVPKKGTVNDIFGAEQLVYIDEIPSVPAILDLERVEQILSETDEIKAQSKFISASVLLSGDEEFDADALDDDDKDLKSSDMPYGFIMAGEGDKYWELFPDLKLIEGHYPTAGTNEVIVDARFINSFKKVYDKDLALGDSILIKLYYGSTLREGKVVGFFNPANENTLVDKVVYCDASLARPFADLTYGSSFTQELPDNVDLSFSEMSEDEFFGDDLFGGIEEDTSVLGTAMDLDNILGDTSKRDELNKADDGAWQYIIAKLNQPKADKAYIAKLNKRFQEEGLNVHAINWHDGAYLYLVMLNSIGNMFKILIVILAIVVFIIIMNTMIVSVIERTSEIGTMRAIGAEKKFVKKLFYTEAVVLTTISSIGGIILAFILMGIFNAINIVPENETVRGVFGGALHFTPTVAIIISTMFVALLGTIISNAYPVKSALKITPIKALSKE